MSTTTTTDQCASAHCKKPLTGRSVIVARNGRRYCKQHGDHLPRYLRRPPGGAGKNGRVTGHRQR